MVKVDELTFKAKNMKSIFIDEACLGKTAVWKSAKEALLSLSQMSNITIFTTDPKRLKKLLKESFGKTEIRNLPEAKEIELEDGRKKKKRVYVDKEVEVLEINPVIINTGKDNPVAIRASRLRSMKNTLCYNMWVIESNKEVVEKFLGVKIDNAYEHTFQTIAGTDGKFFIVTKHTDWNDVMNIDVKDTKKLPVELPDPDAPDDEEGKDKDK